MKNKRKTLLVALLTLTILVILITVSAGMALMYFGSKLDTENTSEDIGMIKTVISAMIDKDNRWEDGVKNILLIGVDNDNSAGMDDLGNADGLIIVSINKNTKQISTTSIMRDTKVELPQGGYTKITLSYHMGGVPLLVETIEKNFDIKIDNYALVNYLDVVQIVDAIGGIELELSADELYHMQMKIENVSELMGQDAAENMLSPEDAGPMTLNGVQTAAYLRIRMAGNNDQERTERARRVLLQIKDKLFELKVSQIIEFVKSALPCVKTDMNQADVLSLAAKSPAFMKYDIVSARIPAEGTYYYSQDGNAFVVIDFERNKEYLHSIIFNGAK